MPTPGGGVTHHRRDEKHDRTEVDPPAQEPERRRRQALPAEVAAETEPPSAIFIQAFRAASRLAIEMRLMELARAKLTPTLLCPGGKIPITGQKIVMKLHIVEKMG